MIVQLLHLFKAAHKPKYCLHGQRAVHSSLIRTYVAISLPCVQALVFPIFLLNPPATCVTSLSKPQNIFLIEFAEQPKSPRMLSHPSTIDLLLNLHPTYIQIIQLPNIALGVQPDSTGELATFMPFSQISAFNLLPKHFFVIIWSHPPPHPVHVSREPGRR